LQRHSQRRPRVSPTTTAPTEPPTTEPLPADRLTTISIVALGDSNTESRVLTPDIEDEWPYLLRDALAAEYPGATFTLHNGGKAGFTCEHFLVGQRGLDHKYFDLDNECLDYDPNIVLAMFGTNDVGSDTPEQREVFYANLTELAGRVTAHENTDGSHPRLVLLQPPVAADGQAAVARMSGLAVSSGPYIYGRYRPGLITLKEVVSEVGAEYSLPVVPIWDNMSALGWSGETNTLNVNILDGVHLSVAGHILVSSWALAAVEDLLYPDGTLGR